MSFIPQTIVNVFFDGFNQRRFLGRLLLRNRQIFFEYDSEFLKSNLEISPFKLPLQSGVMTTHDRMFDGLFGVFDDSLPDGWGRLLLDRKMMQLGVNPNDLSPLDRLCIVGTRGMGALSYEPEHKLGTQSFLQNLDEINEEVQQFQKQENLQHLDDLLALNGSSAGARPKVLLTIANQDWLIKFRSSLDPEDIGCVEYAYHLMAKKAGLDVPEAKLFPSKSGPGFFGVQRFDRRRHNRIHMHTIGGLLHADHRLPMLDYETILKATRFLTQDIQQCEKQYRNAVFNVLSHNRDDHAKNFSFILDEAQRWLISPAYDLTFSSGPAGEHSTMVMGEGKNPGIKHLLKLSDVIDMSHEHAQEIITEVQAAIQLWKTFAVEAQVSKAQQKMIAATLLSF